jgi:prephenate dehydrogenase
MRIAILGVGLIGGSIGLAARERFDGAELVGFGRSRERLEHARDLGAIDTAAETLEEALEGASACFCCAPVGVLPAQVAAVLAAAPGDCVVTDVGSVKRKIVEATRDERFVGGHPIAGGLGAGVDHARSDLFRDAVWYLTPTERSSGLLYERLHRMVAAFGARPVAIDPESHDRLLAAVSHLPHVIANVLVAQTALALTEEDSALPRVGPSFRDATRVAGANSAIWTDIYMTNREAIADQIESVAARMRDVAAILREGDPLAIEAWNEVAAECRRRLLEADLAGDVVHELRLTVPNRPGTVAQVALALGKAGVNIVDMALAPAPDNLFGAITLWIAGEEQTERARGVIARLGFPVVPA